MIEYQLDILQNKILKNFNKNLKIIDNLLFLEGGASKIEYYKQYPITTFIETVDELCKTDKPNIWTYCEPELQQYIKSIKGNIKWLKLRLNIPYIKRKFKSIDSYKLLEKAYFLFRVEKSSNKKIDFQKTDSVYLIINAPDWEKKNKNMYIVHEFLNKDMNPLNFKQKTTQIKFFKIEVNQPKLRGEANLKDLIYKLSNEKMKTYVETMTKTYKQLFNMNNIIVDEPLKKIPITYTIEENKSLNIIKEKKINLLPYDKKLKYKDQKYMDDTLQINIPNNFTNEMLENQEFTILDIKFNLFELEYINNSVLFFNKSNKKFLTRQILNQSLIDLNGIIIFPFSNNEMYFIYNPDLNTIYLYVISTKEIVKEYNNIQYFAYVNYINYIIKKLEESKKITSDELNKLKESIKKIEGNLKDKISDILNNIKRLSIYIQWII